MNDVLRGLPSVDRVLAHSELGGFPPGSVRTNAARDALAEAREAARAGGSARSVDAIAARAKDILEQRLRPSLRRVINATGVLLHTNLGRAPLPASALAAMQEVGRGYSNLEYDLEQGTRGSRFSHLEDLLRRVTGAEAGIAVNNNAAALVLLLSALCSGREVIVSRGQAVEIGGGFRIPDVLRQSGANLVEVGTTNRTSIADFERALTERTVAIMRVHASNFRVIGFTAFPSIGDLAALARRRGVHLLDDLGSGCLIDTAPFGMLHEPTVQESTAAGVDVVAFSGDKLLGGPQAGILAGRAVLIDELRRHPLARALRMDKTSIAGLEATLRHYDRGDALIEIPIWRAIATPAVEIEARARRWSDAAIGATAVVPGRSMIGGGSLPEEGVPTTLLAVRTPSADLACAALRQGEPPIVGRVADGRLLLDPRTVDPADDELVEDAVRRLHGT